MSHPFDVFDIFMQEKKNETRRKAQQVFQLKEANVIAEVMFPEMFWTELIQAKGEYVVESISTTFGNATVVVAKGDLKKHIVFKTPLK
jgi:hypothetical protein